MAASEKTPSAKSMRSAGEAAESKSSQDEASGAANCPLTSEGWIEVVLLTDRNAPVPNERCVVTDPDGNLHYAKELFDQSGMLASKSGDRDLESEANWALGRMIQEEGDPARAAALMQQRVDYEREIGHTQAHAHAADVQAILYQLEEKT